MNEYEEIENTMTPEYIQSMDSEVQSIADNAAELLTHYKKIYYQKNKQRRDEYAKKYYHANKHRMRESQQAYRASNKQKIQEYQQKYRASKRTSS